MANYIVRRIVYMILLLLVLSFVSFIIIQLPPGDYLSTMVDNLRSRGTLSPDEVVDACLEMVGPIEVGEGTRSELLDQARDDGELRWDTEEQAAESERRVGVMMALIAASRDFQFA